MSEKVQFRALQLANEQRSAYGLRYHDFKRYRNHCANRTHRLRSTLKLTHGKGREFKKLPSYNPETLKDGHLQLLLMESERAWAYSQDLIAESLKPENSDKASTLRHHATGRFRRAVHWSTQLLTLCQTLYGSGRISAENLLESTVYTLILNGRFLRYRDDFEDALVQLSVARSFLDELAAAASSSRDQALATLFSDEIGPEIRYCAHELGRAKAYDIDAIVQEFAVSHRNELVDNCDQIIRACLADAGTSSASKRRLEPILWDGEPIPVRNPELVDVLLRVQEAEKKLEQDNSHHESKGSRSSKKGVAAFDAILLALSDTESAARKLVEVQQLVGTTITTTGGRDIVFLHAYIVFQLLSYRIQRDLLLITALLNPQLGGKKSSPVEQDARLFPAIVKLLDTVIQSLNQMRSLSPVDDSPDLATMVDARIAFSQARRCVYISRCYVPVKKYAEALALLQHASLYVRETNSFLSSMDTTPKTPSFYTISPESVSELENTIVEEAAQYKRDWFLYNGGSIDSDHALTYKKPLFFNIAWNYINVDLERLQERAGRERAPPTVTQVTKQEELAEPEPTPHPAPAPSRSGLSSLLGGWWGR